MKKITVYYDEWCPKCTKFYKIVHKVDMLGWIAFRPLRKNLEKMSFIDRDLALQGMPVRIGKQVLYGYDTIFLIFQRLPLFWPVLPLLYLMKVTALGHFLYRELAIRRKIIPLHCSDNCSVNFDR